MTPAAARRAVVAGCLAVVLAGPGTAPAVASKTQLSVFEDDQTMILGGDSLRERTLDDLVTLGVDTVHSIVFWNKVAPAPLSRHRPGGFDGSDPAAYPPELWDRYDGLVRGATARGMDLILSPSSPMPAWASECRGSLNLRKTCRPNPTQFKRFVEALGRRYSGEYADENQGGGVLPRVSRWSIWNEPNQGGWLQPQSISSGGRAVPASPAIYRTLVRAAIAGLRASGHAHDDILFGETAPIGRVTGPASSRPLPPGDFLRDTLCIDGRGRALRGALGRAAQCTGGFPRLAVTGVAHHPYTRGGSQPPTSAGGPKEITISSVGRLKRILNQAAARGRLPGHLPIFYTEFGFQSNPPDHLFGVSLDRQAAYINEADWIAWHDPDVKSVAQYEMRDEANLSAFQTGLRFLDGTIKPAFAAYRMPIWVTRAGSRIRVWGQIRPAEDDAVETVEIQNDRSGSGDFATVATVQTSNRKGYLLTTVARSPGMWRLQWTPSQGGPTITSRVARVSRR